MIMKLIIHFRCQSMLTQADIDNQFDDDDDSDDASTMTTIDIFVNRFIKLYDKMLLFQNTLNFNWTY